MKNLNKQEAQHWLALGLLILVLIFIGLLVVLPIVNKGMDLDEAINSQAFKLQQYQRILAQKDSVINSIEKIKEQQESQGYFNKQDTDALASADMQEFIKKAILDAGGQLSSTQATPVTNKNGFNRITVRVRMMGNSEVLRAVLYKIETATPLIIIDQIDIRPMHGQQNMITRQLDASNDMNINFQAVSFMRKQPE